LDGDYVNGQVKYQKGNAALFRREIQDAADPVDLKQFGRQTLPKIDDHLQRALKFAAASSGGSAHPPKQLEGLRLLVTPLATH
jgi:putative membrane protein